VSYRGLRPALFIYFFISSPADARVYDMFRSDSPRGAFCDAIGGACAADIAVENAFFQNPAVLATGESDWNFDGDIAQKSNLEPGSDPGNLISQTESNGGVGVSSGRFGVGASMTWQKDTVEGKLTIFDENELPLLTKMSTSANLFQFSLPLAYLVSPMLSIGLTPSLYKHDQSLNIPNSTDASGSNLSAKGFGLKFGMLYQPSDRLRVGSWFGIPTTLYESQTFSAQVQSTSINYSEDFALHFPWVWALGGAFDTAGGFSFFAENDLIGPTYHGNLLSYDTLSSASDGKNKSSVGKGRKVVAQPHWGVRKILSRKFTAHFGGYFETARAEGFAGRLHTSAGLSFHIGDWLEIIGGGEVARGFTRVFFTFR
jgi:hypothetical protein